MEKAEEEFWANLAQEQKEIESKEQKRREAFLPKGQPTPIPEEGAEISAEERKVGWSFNERSLHRQSRS